MPNWAMGTVYVTGKQANVLAFSKRFITDDKPSTVEGIKYFARSFANNKREDVEQYIRSEFEGKGQEVETTVEIPMDFAWSAYSCLIAGYPQRSEGECITIQDACVMDQVDVEIRTTEPGMCFEEQISCDREGDLTNECYDLTSARCKHCGEVQGVGSFEDLDEVECYECGEVGFERVVESDGT